MRTTWPSSSGMRKTLPCSTMTRAAHRREILQTLFQGRNLPRLYLMPHPAAPMRTMHAVRLCLPHAYQAPAAPHHAAFPCMGLTYMASPLTLWPMHGQLPQPIPKVCKDPHWRLRRQLLIRRDVHGGAHAHVPSHP